VGGQYTQIEFHDPFPDAETYSPNRVRYPIIDVTLDRRWSDHVYTEIAGYWSNPRLNNTETYAEICKVATGCTDPSTGKPIPFGDATGKSIPFPNKGFGKDSKVGGFRELGLNLRNTLSYPDLFELVTGVQVVSYKNDSDPVFPSSN
jgi:iron complex outermembrane receptor protein